jgi:predicted transcriptional regulator
MTLSLEAQRLLRERLRTPEMLEALITLHAFPGKAWDAQSLAARTGRDAGPCRSILEQLADAQLVRRVSIPSDGCYEYAPADDETARATDQLARSYTEDRLAILRSMNASAMDRLRAAARKLFGASPYPDPTPKDKSR